MFHQTKLKNGIQVILSPNSATAAVSLLVLVKVGSRFESPKVNGVSHFVEHLMFKGTAKRPNTLVISKELDSIGADYNAWTGKEQTGYYIKAQSTHLPMLADMLADMTTNSLFVPEEVARERGTILEEINMYLDNPMAKVEDLFEEDLFGSNSSLGRHVIGTPQTIKALKRLELVNYWQKHYHAGNIVISVSGNFQKASTLRLLEKKFGNIKKGSRNRPAGRFAEIKKHSLCAHHKETSQAHAVLGFPGVSYSHKDKYPLGLLSIILGGNMSSRLFIQVRERLGLCYFIRSSSDTLEDTGTFTIQAGLDLKKFDKALVAISAELKDVKANGVTEDELSAAKEYIKGKMALSQEDSLDVASFYGSQAQFAKSIQTPEEVFKKIDAVSLGNVKIVANAILDRKKVHLTTLSPFKSVKQFAKFLDF
ncbi:MAG: pitrilysin family protein [bacterium]|nr:pitrilysin family protein [bacterium]